MYKLFIKRILDVLLSSIAILILCPILIPIAIGLLLTGEHYIFYLQERIGYKNKKFNIYKFATMLKNSPNIGTGLHTTLKDPRVLPLGGFLRKTKINPKNGNAWFRKALAYETLVKRKEAIACYDKVIEINPKHEDTWHNKSKVHYELGNYKEAIACCDKLIKINPKYANAWSLPCPFVTSAAICTC